MSNICNNKSEQIRDTPESNVEVKYKSELISAAFDITQSEISYNFNKLILYHVINKLIFAVWHRPFGFDVSPSTSVLLYYRPRLITIFTNIVHVFIYIECIFSLYVPCTFSPLVLYQF